MTTPTAIDIPLFTFLQRGFLSCPTHNDHKEKLRFLFVFQEKQKAATFRNKVKADFLVVELPNWICVKTFLTTPPGVDLDHGYPVQPFLNPYIDPKGVLTGEILSRTEFLTEASGKYIP